MRKIIFILTVSLLGTSFSQANSFDDLGQKGVKTFTASLKSTPFLAFTPDENQADLQLASDRADAVCRYFGMGPYVGNLKLELVTREELQDKKVFTPKALANPYVVTGGSLEQIYVPAVNSSARSTALIPFVGLLSYWSSDSAVYFSEISCSSEKATFGSVTM